MPILYLYPVSATGYCPKCGDNADPTLTFLAKTTTLPERIRIRCGTCGWVASDQPCQDAAKPVVGP